MNRTNTKPMRIPFPIRGLGEQLGHSDQEPLTAVSALNVRGFDPRSGRLRGASRAGLEKLHAAQVNGSYSIQDISHVVSNAEPVQSGISQALYSVNTANGSWGLVNNAGTSYADGGTASKSVACACTDSSGNFYVANNDAAGPAIYKIAPDSAGDATWTSALSLGASGVVYGMVVAGTTLYVAALQSSNYKLFRVSTSTGANLDAGGYWVDFGTVSRFTTITGRNNQLAAVGSTHLAMTYIRVRGTFTVNTATDVVTFGTYVPVNGEVMQLSSSSALPSGLSASTDYYVIEASGSTCKLATTATGSAVDITTSGSGTHTAGAGYVRVYNLTTGSFQDVWTGMYGAADICSDNVAFFYAAVSDGNKVYKLSTAPAAQAGGWPISVTGARSVAFDPVNQRLAVATASTPCVQLRYPASTSSVSVGTAITTADPGSETAWSCVRADGTGGFLLWTQATSKVMRVDSALAAVWGPSTLGSGTANGMAVNTGTPLLAQPQLSGRSVIGLVVAGGTIKKWTSSGYSSVTNGSEALNAALPQIFSAQLGTKHFFADGVVYRYYDARTDAVLDMEETAGTLPIGPRGERARQVERWRGRLVYFGFLDDPQNWHMSKIEDAFDWDVGATAAEGIAVSGNLSATGLVGDKINGMIPYSDDLAVFLCDHEVWQLTGDPTANGRLDRVSSVTGGAWGRAWCLDRYGSIYFFGSRGGVYKLTIGQDMQCISNRIEERFRAVDMSTTVVRMAYDDNTQHVHVFLTPLTSSTATTHYAYDTRNEAWWADQFADTDLNPKAVHVFDGDDADDRVMILGSWDGYLRKMSLTAVDDDGSAIESYVTIGPIQGSDLGVIEVRDLICVLDEDSAPVRWEVYAGNAPQRALARGALAFGTWRAERNHATLVRRTGAALYLKILQNQLGRYWALETLTATLAGTSEHRRRLGI